MADWILAFDRPYYPSIERFPSRQEAEAALREIARRETSQHPSAYEASCYIAEVVERHDLRVDH